MFNQKLISICIPTYNNHKFISETLDSIYANDTNDVEIIIFDSSESIKTKNIVLKYLLNNNIHYYRGVKGGIDNDLIKNLSYANGKYCWLLSSDDVLKKNAISYLISYLRKYNPDVVLFNRIICDINLRPRLLSKPWLKTLSMFKIFNFYNLNNFNNYLKKCNSIGGIFSYMSTLIIKKNKWDKVNSSIFIGSNYAHAYRILSILFKMNSKLLYLNKKLVYFRGDNDSFKDNGYLNRIKIDFLGYDKIINYFITKKEIINSFYKLMQREHKFYYLLRLRDEVNSNEWLEFKNTLIKFNYPYYQIWIINFLGNRKLLIKILRAIKKKLNF